MVQNQQKVSKNSPEIAKTRHQPDDYVAFGKFRLPNFFGRFFVKRVSLEYD